MNHSSSQQRVHGMFRVRLQQALSKRIGSHTGLNRKQLAFAIGAHGKTLDQWMAGRGSPSFEMACEMVAFFKARGDRTFAAEVFDIAPPEPRPAIEIATRMEEMARQIREMVPA